MNREALADRFVSYSDAATFFPLVQSVAFSAALADPDIRCSVAEIWLQISAGNLFFSILILTAIIILRRAELSLREEGELDAKVTQYLSRIHLGRLAVVWLTFFYLLLSVYSTTLDQACLAVSAL